ncbi:MAG TPA: hypothetical protein VH079_18005, partial [Terriglobales bacterium]|nr:hypothetical protein [Terriglobales bacterium]
SVEWSKTSAYAVGLGGIYLNFKGREHAGILEEGTKADRVRTAIQSGLTGLPDVHTRQAAIRSVSKREDLYFGAFAGNAPDLLVNFNPGFRVSWHTAVGGFANSMIEDNMRRWSGDHIVDPEAVPGILFMNRIMSEPARAPRIIDLAPTILNYLGLPAPNYMEGNSLI